MFIARIVSGVFAACGFGLVGIYIYKKNNPSYDKNSLIFDSSGINEINDVEMLQEAEEEPNNLITNFETSSNAILPKKQAQSIFTTNSNRIVYPNKLFYKLKLQKITTSNLNSFGENCEWSFQEKNSNNQMEKINFSSLIFYTTKKTSALAIDKNNLKKIESNENLFNNNNNYVIELNREDDGKWLLKKQSNPKKEIYITGCGTTMAQVLSRTSITVN